MRTLCQLVVAVVLAGLVGCGSEDPNKNLKPVDPNVKVPKPVRENPGTAEKPPAPIIK